MKKKGNLALITMFALRYALGRQTASPGIVSDFIKANVNNFNYNAIKAMIAEIRDCKDYGMYYDKETWLELAEVLDNVILERELPI